MVNWYKLYKNPWLRRSFLGGIGVLGTISSFPEDAAKSPLPSTAMQSWISDARRKEGQDGYSIAELGQQPSGLIQFAAHRSHRSHASHFSSATGHRSHYSSYTATPQSPAKDPPRQIEENKKTDSNLPEIPKKVVTVASKENGKLVIEAKTGTVKSIISPTAFILEDATIVELIGAKEKKLSSPVDDANAHASAQASLTGWVSGKSVRINFLEGNKAYVFVFPNELECYCINLEMIKEGKLVVDSNTSIYARNVLLKAQREAQSKDLGIWKKETGQK